MSSETNSSNPSLKLQANGDDEPAVAEKSLLPEQVANGLSILGKIGSGLAHAYTKLELHNLGVTSIDVLEQYPHIRLLDLSGNNIHDIEPLGKLDYLLSLNLSANHLKSISPALNKTKFLQILNLSNNFITQNRVATLPYLKTLNLNRNRLDRLELDNFPELQYLEARENVIEDFRGINAPKLKQLYLSFNKIATLQGLSAFKMLEVVYLRGNQIQDLSGFNLDANCPIQHLNLRQNKIASLDELLKLGPLTSLTSLTVLENPISEGETHRAEIVSRLPRLLRLNKLPITEDEREEAANLVIERQNAVKASMGKQQQQQNAEETENDHEVMKVF